MVIRLAIVRWFGAAAITIWPFVFVGSKRTGPMFDRLMRHERVHLGQQRRWFVWGLGVGLIVWLLLYLCVLPVGWNPFRYKWEAEAMREGEGMSDREIAYTLRGNLYKLWWM